MIDRKLWDQAYGKRFQSDIPLVLLSLALLVAALVINPWFAVASWAVLWLTAFLRIRKIYYTFYPEDNHEVRDDSKR
jgi:hypothetical protein